MKKVFFKKSILLLIVLCAGAGLVWSLLSMDLLANKYQFKEITKVCIIAFPVVLLLFGNLMIFRGRRFADRICGVLGISLTRRRVKRINDNKESRFYMLSQTDKRMEGKVEKFADDNTMSMQEFCERFRQYAASKLKLYYNITDIRRFIAGMSVSHILIMQGMSGTGKTSLAYAFGEFLQNHSTIVPIQPMWKERTDLIGYYNEFTNKFNETVLLQKMYEANYSKNIYVTVLDEMNIARVEYYFAEFLSLLEIPNPEGRYLDVVTDKKKKDPKKLKNGQLKLPTNMWFVGTINNDDSTFAVSDKVYDRAMVMNLDSKAEIFESEEKEEVKISVDYWEKMIKRARSEYRLTERAKRKIEKIDQYLVDHFHITFGNRIMKQISQYVPVVIACGGEESEAIDDILAKKVLRKLESQNPIYIRNSVDGLKDYLDEVFGQDKMVCCKDYLTKLGRTA